MLLTVNHLQRPRSRSRVAHSAQLSQFGLPANSTMLSSAAVELQRSTPFRNARTALGCRCAGRLRNRRGHERPRGEQGCCRASKRHQPHLKQSSCVCATAATCCTNWKPTAAHALYARRWPSIWLNPSLIDEMPTVFGNHDDQCHSTSQGTISCMTNSFIQLLWSNGQRMEPIPKICEKNFKSSKRAKWFV